MKKVTDLKENECILCTTEEECNAIMDLMHEAGLKWRSGYSYIERGRSEIKYLPKQCYFPHNGSQSSFRDADEAGEIIHPASDFIPQKNTMKITLTSGKEITLTKEELEEVKEYREKNMFPKWEDLEEISGYYVDGSSSVRNGGIYKPRVGNKTLRATKEQAEACLAMSQLSQLMKHVNGDWKPDWSIDEYKYCIIVADNVPSGSGSHHIQNFLAFPTREIRDGFLEAYRDLIEIAKPLI